MVVALNNDTEAAALDVDVATLGLPEATELADNLGALSVAARVIGGRLRTRSCRRARRRS